MAERTRKCVVVTEPSFDEGASSFFFSLECGQSYAAYELLFRNTRVNGTLSVQLFVSECTFTVTVESNDQPPIVRTIAPTDNNRSIALTVDCLEKITFSCTGTAADFCDGVFILLLRCGVNAAGVGVVRQRSTSRF